MGESLDKDERQTNELRRPTDELLRSVPLAKRPREERTQAFQATEGLASAFSFLRSIFCEQYCGSHLKSSECTGADAERDKVSQERAVEKFSPGELEAFLNAASLKKANAQKEHERLSMSGRILAQKEKIDDRRRQKYPSDYLEYKNI